ncbi:MAG: TIGR02757 family protein [Cryomorphaceae bacterium]|nr:TIGR02757 family protein [Cryomorphaceae bacterium]
MKQIQRLLNEKVLEYNSDTFVIDDPISIPHRFSKPGDIEVAAFFAALFAWGQRKTIIDKTNDLLQRMDDDPFEFVMHAGKNDLNVLKGFVHRTFNADDVRDLILALRATRLEHGEWSKLFQLESEEINYGMAISRFRREMLGHVQNPVRVSRFLSDPVRGSAAKRLVMFLRWMVRRDNAGVDFGLWTSLPMSYLSCPLDVHTARVARHLGLLTRKQNDWRAVEALDANLRTFDPTDPAKYDFALFGLGVSGEII